MATLDEKTPDPFAKLHLSGAYDWDKEGKLMDDLQAASDSLPDPITNGYTIEQLTKALVGRILKFPYADGHATYRVTSIKPLKLQPLAYWDAWQIPYAQIRGLRLQDVCGMVLRDIKFRQLFAKKS